MERKTNHLVHLAMTIGTMGLWAIIWRARWRANKRHNEALREEKRRHDDLIAAIRAANGK